MRSLVLQAVRTKISSWLQELGSHNGAHVTMAGSHPGKWVANLVPLVPSTEMSMRVPQFLRLST
jgi:hypothetical protein